MPRLDTATASVNELFEVWAPVLYRYAFRFCRSAELADDMVQDAFLALYQEMCTGETIRSPRAWTLSVVRHSLANWRRGVRRHPEELTPPEDFDLMPLSVEGAWEEDVARDDLDGLLALLTPRETEVVLLRMQSLKHREIASQLGIGLTSVATLLARALKKMQAAARKTENREAPSRC